MCQLGNLVLVELRNLLVCEVPLLCRPNSSLIFMLFFKDHAERKMLVYNNENW